MRGPWPTAATRLVGLLGWPARHSLSPVMHNAAFREHGLDLVYVALPTPPDRLGTVVDALSAVEAAGANVTVPHKQAVVSLCDRLTAEAELVGAVNTLVWSADELVGDNTDAVGLETVLRDDLGAAPGLHVVLLGAGGAARAAAVALGRLSAHVTVVARRADAAEEVAALVVTAGGTSAASVVADERAVTDAVGAAELVANATPLGMAGEPLPGSFLQLRPGQVAFDVVYGPLETPFLAAARAAGAEAVSGLGLLVAQAVASFERWTGQVAPAATMSAAALAALATSGETTAYAAS